MSSQINPSNIDSSYPIAGQDNDSQGFRNNFLAILNNFKSAQSEITDIQNKGIFKSSLTGQTLNNDFGHGILANVQLRSSTYNIVDHGTWNTSTDGPLLLSYDLGNYHRVSTNGSVTVDLTPTTSGLTTRGSERISLLFEIVVNDVSHNLNLPTVVTDASGTLSLIAGSQVDTNLGTKKIVFASTGTFTFEFNSIDGGSTITIRDLSRNVTTVDDNLTVAGNLVVNGSFTSLFQSTEIVAGNLVANSGAASTNTTTGALVVQGGSGISGNVNVGGNVVAQGGMIRSNYLYLTRVTGATMTANVAYEKFWLDSASSATLAAQTISLPAGAENGRLLEITALCPITTTTWSGGTAKYLSSSIFTAGNVTAKLMWSTTASAWLKR